MTKPNLKGLLDELAQMYGLRYVEHEKRFLGLNRGICIDAWEYDGSLHFYFHSPSVQLTADDILEKRKSFPNLAESAIPVEWVQYRMNSGSELDRHGCSMEFSPERLAVLSEQELLAIPDIIGADLVAHGASVEPPPCSMCGGPAGTNPMYANDVYQFACQTCFEKLRDFAPDGVVKRDVPIKSWQVARTLTLWSVGFTLLWGLVQTIDMRVDGRMLLAAPFVASIFFCRAVGKAAEGMSLSLRLITITCILICVLAGNIWGFRAAVLKQGELSWAKTIFLYFTVAIPDPNGSEWWYLIGGLAGCWVGFRFLKKQNVVKYQ